MPRQHPYHSGRSSPFPSVAVGSGPGPCRVARMGKRFPLGTATGRRGPWHPSRPASTASSGRGRSKPGKGHPRRRKVGRPGPAPTRPIDACSGRRTPRGEPPARHTRTGPSQCARVAAAPFRLPLPTGEVSLQGRREGSGAVSSSGRIPDPMATTGARMGARASAYRDPASHRSALAGQSPAPRR